MARRTKERIKTLIIFLLLISVLFLSLAANYYSGATDTPLLARLFGGSSALPPKQAQAPALTDAAQPLLISVLGDAGRSSFWGNFEQLDSVFEGLGGYLAEALDTAGEPIEVTARVFRQALSGPGIYFVYPAVIPLDVTAAWLDAETRLTLSANRFLLTVENDSVTLCLMEGSRFWQVPTAVDAATLVSVLDDYPADGSFFAMESDESPYSRLDPLSLVDPSAYSVAGGQSANPCDEAFMIAAAAALGFNPYGDSTYRDDAGNTVYTETDCSLRISADGVLTLRNQGLASRFSAASPNDGDQIEYVRTLLQDLTDGLSSDGRLMLSGFGSGTDGTTVEFDYILSGLHVEQSDGPAVLARFSGEVLTSLTFRIRTYTLQPAEPQPILPAAQAAAALPKGASLFLAYADYGSGTMQAGWLQ